MFLRRLLNVSKSVFSFNRYDVVKNGFVNFKVTKYIILIAQSWSYIM